MAAPAFGFSVGDFIAAIKLLDKAAKALRESSGATSQFQQAAAELESIYDILNRTQALVPTARTADIIQKAHVCARTCHIPLARFLEKLKLLEPYLGSTGNSPRYENFHWKFRRAGRKVQWAFTLENEVAKLKLRINPQLAAIAVLLQLESLERTAEFQSSSQRIAYETQKCAEATLSSLERFKDTVANGLLDQAASADNASQLQKSHSIDLTGMVQQMTVHPSELTTRFAKVEDMLNEMKSQVECIRPVPAPSFQIPHGLTRQPDKTAEEFLKGRSNTDLVLIHQLSSIASSIRNVVERVLLMLLLLIPSIQQMLRTLQVVRRGPSLLLQDNIHLEDALGRSLSLPYEHFRYWPVLFARLQEAFSGLPGELRVKHNQFHIMNMRSSGNRVLTKHTWDRAVFPGSRLAMSMLYLSSDFAERLCPRCQNVDILSLTNQWVKCTECELIYRVLNVRPLERKSSPSARLESDDVMDGVEFINDMKQIDDEGQSLQILEIQFFKRIHLIGTPAPVVSVEASHEPQKLNRSASGMFNGEQLQDPDTDKAFGLDKEQFLDKDIRYTYTEPAGMFRYTEPSWRQRKQELGLATTLMRKKAAVDKANASARARGDHVVDITLPSPTRRESLPSRIPKKKSSTSNYGTDKKSAEDVTKAQRPDEWNKGDTEKATDAKQSTSTFRKNNSYIPPGARWTKINRDLIDPEVLVKGRERFEERLDCVIVLRVLTRDEIRIFVDRTKALRKMRAIVEEKMYESTRPRRSRPHRPFRPLDPGYAT